jgi:superfamily II DNA helicase RecQ
VLTLDTGVRSAPYHAGLDEDYRYAVQDEWVAVRCAFI